MWYRVAVGNVTYGPDMTIEERGLTVIFSYVSPGHIRDCMYISFPKDAQLLEKLLMVYLDIMITFSFFIESN